MRVLILFRVAGLTAGLASCVRASAGLPSITTAEHPVTPSVAPWNGAVLLSAEISYRGTTTVVGEQSARLIATSRCCVLMREIVRFDKAISDLVEPEELLVVGLTQVPSS